jgi:hypothetical protein
MANGNRDEEEQEQAGRGFRVVDRRGQARDEPAEEPQRPAPAQPPPEPPPGRDAGSAPGGARGGAAPGGAAGDLPKIDFATFALSLGTSALYHLGLVADPETGQPTGEPNVALARQTIDTLEMLQEKTRGNLDTEEAHLLESLLYELRMRFVEASQ